MAQPAIMSKKIKIVKQKKQVKFPHHPNKKYTRHFQLWYDSMIELDTVMDETASKIAFVAKFKDTFKRLLDEESSIVLYL